MSYWLGIDVGTTFTAAAVCREEAGRRALPEVVPLGTRSTAVSSVIYLAEDGQVVVGEAAERRAVTDSERVVREFKRRIGDEVPMMIGGVPHSAPEIAAMVARWVVDRVAEREGGPAAGVVITHPAGWGVYKIQIMADALRATGLPDITFRTEPEAAAASYALQERIDTGSTIAVYDLGGGTFDAAVVRKTGATTFSVLGIPQGIDQLGGADFDDAIFDYVVGAVPGLSELDPEDPATLTATAALRRECTEAKEALSVDTEVTIPVLTPQVRSQVRLVRAEFEDMIRPQVAETVEALRRALRSADIAPQDLDAVLLVGGSSRMPLVAQLVSAELGRPVAVDADPKAAIALGAALSALPAGTAEAFGSDSAGAVTASDAPTQVVGEPQLEVPQRPAIPVGVEPAEMGGRRDRSRRVKQVALAGVLGLVTTAGAVSLPFLTARSSTPPTDARTPAPATTPPALPPAPAAPDPATNGRPSGDEDSRSTGSGGAVRMTPTAAPSKPAGGSTKPAPAGEPAAPDTWSTSHSWTTSWSNPPPPRGGSDGDPNTLPGGDTGTAPGGDTGTAPGGDTGTPAVSNAPGTSTNSSTGTPTGNDGSGNSSDSGTGTNAETGSDDGTGSPTSGSDASTSQGSDGTDPQAGNGGTGHSAPQS
ncbi:MAG: Hsp70 family protein [Actinomycetota bacterium]|nr:Hsp70 family protein [Actinomycetota bacterium]